MGALTLFAPPARAAAPNLGPVAGSERSGHPRCCLESAADKLAPSPPQARAPRLRKGGDERSNRTVRAPVKRPRPRLSILTEQIRREESRKIGAMKKPRARLRCGHSTRGRRARSGLGGRQKARRQTIKRQWRRIVPIARSSAVNNRGPARRRRRSAVSSSRRSPIARGAPQAAWRRSPT
jgi:hypothetical protein